MKITLKAARVNAGLSQSEASKRLEVSTKTLQNYESGATVPDWVMVRKIEALYSVKIDDILFLSKIPLKAKLSAEESA